MPNKSVIIKL